ARARDPPAPRAKARTPGAVTTATRRARTSRRERSARAPADNLAAVDSSVRWGEYRAPPTEVPRAQARSRRLARRHPPRRQHDQVPVHRRHREGQQRPSRAADGRRRLRVHLVSGYLKYGPRDPHWPDRDRFILSAGHGSMLLYSLLHLAGYDLPLDELKQFRQWGSRTPGHPEAHLTAGVEATTGPLGQGFANGVGMALAAKMAQA